MDNVTQYIDNTPRNAEERILVGQEIIEALPSPKQFRAQYPKSLPWPVKAIIYFEPYWSEYVGSENDLDCGGGANVEIHMENGAIYQVEKLDPLGDEESTEHSGPWEEYMTPEVEAEEEFEDTVPFSVIDLANELIPRHYFWEFPEGPGSQ